MFTTLPQGILGNLINALGLEVGDLVMSACVIPFPGKWSSGGSRAKTKKVRPSSRKRPSRVEAQVRRITELLTELEDLSPPSADVSAVLTQAQATIKQVRERLASRGLPPPEDEGDAQPHVDREVMERHFQALD